MIGLLTFRNPEVATKLSRRDSLQFSALDFSLSERTFMIWYIIRAVLMLLWDWVRLSRMTHQARQLMWKLDAEGRSFTHLIHDNDGKYSIGFDSVFESQGVEVVRTPIRAPRANAYAEPWVRSVREECLDRIIILNQAHLVYARRSYEQYFNQARPHQGIKQCIPCPPTNLSTTGEVERRDILGGVIHDYYRAA